jgi:cytochrome c oxidase subunit 3
MVKALKLTFMMFIGSEVMFFVGIFWCYFDSALSPSINIGCQWPPVGIVAINPWGIPFFNTVVLLRRGSSLT